MLTFNTSQCPELLLSSLQNVKREAPDLSGIRPLGIGEADGGVGVAKADGEQDDAATVEC